MISSIFKQEKSSSFRCERNIKLAEKYFALWLVNTRQRKLLQNLETKNKYIDDEINEFINKFKLRIAEKLRAKKSPVPVPATIGAVAQNKENSYKNVEKRLLAQEEVIEAQKAFITEQMRTIEKIKVRVVTGQGEELQRKQCPKSIEEDDVSMAEALESSEESYTRMKWKNKMAASEEHPLLEGMRRREEERRQRRVLLELQRRTREELAKEREIREAQEKRKEQMTKRKKKQKEERLKKEAEDRKKEAERELARRLETEGRRLREELVLKKTFQVWRWRTLTGQKEARVVRKALELEAIDCCLREWRAGAVSCRSRLEEVRAVATGLAALTAVWKCWSSEARWGIQIKETLKEYTEDQLKESCFLTWKSYTKKLSRRKHQILSLTKELYDCFLLEDILHKWNVACHEKQERRLTWSRLRLWEDTVRSLLPDYSGLEPSHPSPPAAPFSPLPLIFHQNYKPVECYENY